MTQLHMLVRGEANNDWTPIGRMSGQPLDKYEGTMQPPPPCAWINQTEKQGLIGIEEVQDLVLDSNEMGLCSTYE